MVIPLLWYNEIDTIEKSPKARSAKEDIMAYPLWNLLKDLRNDYDWVELSHPVDQNSPIWSGMPEGVLEIGKTVFDWGNPILECQIQTFKFPGQFGTHIDFPGHFVKGKPNSEGFSVEHMAYPLCVIDITDKVKEDVHYAVSAADIQAYEKEYGDIPDGAFVALRTDWSKRWPDGDKVAGLGDDGAEHCPGWSLEALRYIYEVRNAAANGHETLDTDASKEAAAAGDLACERYVLSHGKVQVEVMTNLDKVAPAGAIVFVTWPRIQGATGLPARVIAITPKK